MKKSIYAPREQIEKQKRIPLPDTGMLRKIGIAAREIAYAIAKKKIR